MKNRTTPEKITNLKKGQIFVFGSNQAGRHGAGAAKFAMEFGARYGQAAGIQGKTYAIPTKNYAVSKTLPQKIIGAYIKRFIDYAKMQKDKTFLVTAVGCGLASLRPQDIAPLFKDAMDIENIHLPRRFWEILNESIVN